ncbi:DUF6701 domain-containing protein [Chitinimonas lacunae]|uniref:DUF6701 domain-containing protein n=1 Tax=Chitinimonas lacunae TaxID=1963018 RepID=A0ABV8MVF8_9NEIS
MNRSSLAQLFAVWLCLFATWAQAACGPIPSTYPVMGGTLSISNNMRVNSLNVSSGVANNRAINPSTGGWTAVSPASLLPTVSPAWPGTPGWIVSFPWYSTLTPDDYWWVVSLGNVSTTPGTYSFGSLSVYGSLELAAGSYYINDLTLNAGAVITTTGTVRLFIGNSLSSGSDVDLNVGGSVANLQVYVYSGSSLSFGNNLNFRGVILGESGSSIQFSNNALIRGAVLTAGYAQFSNNAQITYSAADASAVGSINTCGGTVTLQNFNIDPGSASANTCSPKSITFTARKADGTTLTNYSGTMTLSTSTGRGDWAKVSGGGTLSNGTANDGAAMYTFVAADNGQVVLSLDNERADDLTVSALDATVTGSTSTSSTIQFRDNALVLNVSESASYVATNTAYVGVAGRPHRFEAEVWRKDASTGNQCQLASNFSGNITMRFWITPHAQQPAGAALPAVAAGLSGNGCASPVTLGSSTPGSTTLTLAFSSGVASFYLCPGDVGKYTLNGQINPATQVGTGLTALNASSNTLTVRPFGLAISGLSSAGSSNSGGTAASDAVFGVAGMPFSATLTAYGYNPTGSVDSDGNGHPDSNQSFSQLDVTARRTNGFAGSVTLSARTAVTGQTLGALSNPTVTLSAGSATPTTLAYSEVGSFAWRGASDNSPVLTSYLGTPVTLYAQGFVASGAQNQTVGRFKPHHFALASASVTPACPSGSFTYMGQPQLNAQLSVEARNAAGVITSNYTAALARAGNSGVTINGENNNSGTSLAARLSGLSGSWSNGVWTSLSTARLTVSSPTSATADTSWGPYDVFQLGVVVNDPDASATTSVSATDQVGRPKLAGRTLQDNATSCTADSSTSASDGTCTTAALGTTSRVRYGRAWLGRATSYGQPLRMPSELQYWSGSTWSRHTDDSCSAPPPAQLRYCPVNATNQIGSGQTSASSYATAQAGQLGLTLAVPTPNASSKRRDGIVDVSLNLTSHPWLGFNWGSANDCAGTAFATTQPRARAQFVSGNNPGNLLYQREVY